MRKWMWLISLWLLLFTPIIFAADKALVLDVSGAIGPATQDFIQRGIHYAKQKHFSLIIIQLDTPGGLETSMRGINEAIMTSPIPVLTYVAPAGARAASAGTFILYASHLAAMASGTNVGAASPINLMSTESKTQSTEEKKMVNDAAAYIRSLAQLRGRNVNFAEQAVRQGISISATEAKKLKVIDEIADSYPELLQKINGHTAIVLGVSTPIKTDHLQLITMTPDWRYQFLAFITNPSVAYILMLIAIYGIFFELANPGLILPGVAGLISLLLVLYAFQLMPINYAGLSLMLVGITFMVFEVYVSSFGVIGIGGIIAFILGSILLFGTHHPNFQITLWLIIPMSILTLLFFFVILTLAIRSHKKAILTGREGLIGMDGVVLSVMNKQIVVKILGEIWEAESSVMLDRGQKVKVTHVHGLKLQVEPYDKEHNSGDSP